MEVLVIGRVLLCIISTYKQFGRAAQQESEDRDWPPEK